jgi:N-acetyl-gamma-glutamyl-phosphate reductase
VYENRDLGHLLLVARLDNLGKGASGQAVQNLDLMLGLSDEGRDYGVPRETAQV